MDDMVPIDVGTFCSGVYYPLIDDHKQTKRTLSSMDEIPKDRI